MHRNPSIAKTTWIDTNHMFSLQIKPKKKINRKNKYIKLNMNTGAKPVKAENTLTFSPLSDGK